MDYETYENALERHIADLPDRQRAVFVLHDIHGWEYEEIAIELRITQGAVRANRFQAVKKLRGKLG